MNPESDFAAEVIRDFNSKLSPHLLGVPPQECVTIRKKPIVSVRLGLIAPCELKPTEELRGLSVEDLEHYFHDVIADLRSLGLKFDFFPAFGLENTVQNRRLVYLEALEHLRATLFSQTVDATKLGL